MKKVLIKLILLAVVGGAGGLYYLWHQATKLPDEYVKAVAADRASSQSLPLPPRQIAAQVTVSKNKITTPIERAKVGDKVAVKLTDRDLNNLVVAKLAASQTNKQVPAGIKGINTNIKDGKIHAGALVNLGKLAKDGQPGSQAAALSKLTDRLPFLKDRDVYVGLVGTPVVEGQKIKFNEDTQIKVGNMNFTISQLAENLGVSQDKIQQAIDLRLQQQNLQVDRVNLTNNQIEIDGAKK
jgi:hypothetical protein